MAHNVFVGIGVARPQGMAELPGVSNSLNQMAKWAARESYSVIEILSDEGRPVTAPLIADKLRPILEEAIDRIVVYFVGHGFLNSPDQIWILSNGPEVNTGRISRDALRASISTYRPKQISMIADACLESRHFQSGTVPVLYDAPGPRRRVFVDNIFSTLPNNPSFFFRDKERDAEFCLFTSVLVDFLNGVDKRAFRLANGVLPNVTTQTLYWNLPDAVLERGAVHGVDQEPRVEPGFPQGDDVYSTFGEADGASRPQPPGDDDGAARPSDPKPPGDNDAAARPPDPSGSPNGDVRRQLRDSIPLGERTTEIGSRILPLLEESQVEQLKTEAFHWNKGLTALINREGAKASWGIIINEAPTGFFTAPIQDSDGRSIWYPILRSDLDKAIPYEGRRPGSILTISWSTRVKTQSLH